MGVFGFLKLPDINQEIREYQADSRAVLLDVRDLQEYERGHVPGAVNIPRDEIERAKEVIPDPNTPIYAYCYSGRRSDLAVTALKKMGYRKVKNIGGIASYKGELES